MANGSYFSLDNGDCISTIKDLTGCPGKEYLFRDFSGKKSLRRILNEHTRKKFLISVKSKRDIHIEN